MQKVLQHQAEKYVCMYVRVIVVVFVKGRRY